MSRLASVAKYEKKKGRHVESKGFFSSSLTGLKKNSLVETLFEQKFFFFHSLTSTVGSAVEEGEKGSPKGVTLMQ